MTLKMARHHCNAFSLTELLIALLILGQIAAFSIPKVLVSQQNASWKAAAKETAAMASEAYNILQLKGVANSNTRPSDLLPYLNYVKKSTSGSIDGEPGVASYACMSARPCLLMHNGATVMLWEESFAEEGGYIQIGIDPDSKDSGLPNGPGKSQWFVLYQNGRITTWGTHASAPSQDTSWFSWN